MHRVRVTFQVVLSVGGVSARVAQVMARGPHRDAVISSQNWPSLSANEELSLLLLLLLTTTMIIMVIHPRGVFQVLEKLAIEHQQPVAPPGEHKICCSNGWMR